METPRTESNRAVGAPTWALMGVVSTLVGLAVGQLVAALVRPDASPVLATGSTVIDLTPTPLKNWAIETFGTADKAILLGSVLVVVLVLAAVAGLLARRRLVAGATLEGLLVLVATVLALVRPQSGVLDAVPGIATGVAGVGSLVLLHRVAASGLSSLPWLHPADDEADAGARPTRRGVLLAAGALAVVAAAAGGASRLVARLRTGPADVTLPPAADPAGAFPTGLDGKVKGITPLRTAIGDFYRVDTRLDVPAVDVDSWTLTIDGDVENELTFTFDDLLAMDLIERDITLTCVSNSVGGPYAGGARWLGVRLTDLLDQAGVGDRADQILSTDFDGMTISTPLAVATDGRDAMIAVGMNGEALSQVHGFPARMVVPGLYGFVSACKWITRMTLTTYDDAQAYWTERDWATDAPIKISARIDTPAALEQLDAGEVTIGGVAWAQQSGGVGQVQVSIDGGPWTDAEAGPDVANDYWRQWFLRWDAEPGSHSISARVVTGSGEVQQNVRADPFPDGASGIHTLQVTVG
ncbi:molybdopterin-dependent oxidoreductase [Nocardioides bruguierae]|uniref:Molybdopterin-dependent oxidoreductase n=1 Tax=Nocardioides bruguierae TaxID=2945102 RepID=A0A9X2IDZ0_9ACTN|nr:molybdopterin-dependent oxidoreductase [Nocardioides bruguierae]MCM0620271.1 molybdopterin-dependent oxidoreductase [Nocardioides bruguierae]